MTRSIPRPRLVKGRSTHPIRTSVLPVSQATAIPAIHIGSNPPQHCIAMLPDIALACKGLGAGGTKEGQDDQ